MKIDLHVHSYERSGCAISSEKDQIEAAIAKGLDGIAFTDHNSQRSKRRINSLNEKYAPFKIFTGVEIDIENSHEHLLVLGVSDMVDMCEHSWTYPELHAFVRERNGYIAMAHPYRYENRVRSNIYDFVPDALEIQSNNTIPRNTPAIISLAKEIGTKTIAASDAHVADRVGTYYVELHNTVQTDEDLVRELRSGRYGLGSSKPCKKIRH